MPAEVAFIATALFEGVLKKLAVNVLYDASRRALVALKNVDVDFEEHLRISYDRCTQIKTILNRDEPINLLSLYVNLKFKAGNNKQIDDFDLIELMESKKRTIITGSGGGGKTIL